MEKNKKNINLDNKKLFIISLTLLIGVIVIILFASSYFRDFGKIRVSENNKKIFTVSDLTINNLKFGNDILLIKDSFSNDYFDFGIKITKEGFVPNKSLLELYSLCKAENNSTYPMTSRLNVKFNNYYSITSFFECPSLTTEVKDKTEWMKLFKLLEEA